MTALVEATGPEGEVAAGGAFPNSTSLTSGNYVVTWLDMAGPTNETLVAVFNSDGTQVGTTYTLSAATGYHALAPLASGGFVVVYTTTGEAIAQIFDAAGTPVGGAVPLGTIDYYSNSTFDVEGLAGGGFAASWRNGSNISVKTFDATGLPVATLTPDVGPGSSSPQISQLANGTIALTWHEYDLVSPFSGGYPDGYEVSTQLFSADGTALSPRLTVNQTQLGSHAEPQTVALADGGFVVTWVAQGDALSGGAGIWCQVYDASGTALGSNVRVSDLSPGYQAQPDVAALSWGGFLVTWMDSSPNNPENFSSGIRAQLFDGTGARVGDTIQVNAQLYADEVNPSVVIVSDTEARIFFRSDGNADPSGLLDRVIALPVAGTNGDDTLIGTSSSARIIGLSGADTITGTSGDDFLAGGDGDDTISGLAGNDEIHGGPGADLMDGGDGNDTLNGEAGDDIVTGGGGNDLLYGAEGNDALDGGDGDDILVGGAGNDVLDGSAGNDALYGEDGDDVLIGGPGNDRLEGGAGIDTADYSSSVSWVTAYLLTGQASHGVSLNSSDYYTDQLVGIENLIGSSFGDQLVGDGGNNRLDGGAGNDDLVGWFGNDVLIGGSGNDYLSGREDADVLTGGEGKDSFTDTASGLNGDTITDFGVGDRIVITDANIAGFTFGLNGGTLTYAGGSLTLVAPIAGTIIARAAAGGGVELSLNDARNDFNGDGRSDVLWRSDSGQLTDWLGQANGGFVDNGGNATTFVPVSWVVAGTGDLNGDGRDDILWRNSDGQLTNWLGTANGGFTDNGANGYAVVATSWHVAGIADFNGDGRDDILWRNDNGAMTNWLGTASGGYTDNSANASVTIGTSWQIAGTGDFNGDGRDDILWRNTDGSLTDWLGQANGSLANNAAASTSVATSWQIAATGDFNGDGRDDILWRNTDGQLTDWLGQADGSFANNPNASVWVPTSWHIAATGDFNGDGRDDILWRNDSGDLTNWLGQADGSFANNPNASVWVPTAWHVQVETGTLF